MSHRTKKARIDKGTKFNKYLKGEVKIEVKNETEGFRNVDNFNDKNKKI